MDTESDPKINAGGFLRSLILDEFLIRKKLIAGGVASSLFILRGEGEPPLRFRGGPF